MIDPTRTQSETGTSPMRTRVLIGMLYGVVAVLRQMNGRMAGAMRKGTNIRLRQRRQMRQ